MVNKERLIEIKGKVIEYGKPIGERISVKFECLNCGAILFVLQKGDKFSEPTRCSCGWKKHFKRMAAESVLHHEVFIEELSTEKIFVIEVSEGFSDSGLTWPGLNDKIYVFGSLRKSLLSIGGDEPSHPRITAWGIRLLDS